MVLTDEQKAKAIAAVRRGMAVDLAGKLIGISSASFHRVRRADPELERAIFEAISEWDAEMLGLELDAIASGKMSDATAINQLRMRRLPQYYSTDARMRRPEDHAEDASEQAPASSDSAIDAIEAILEARKGGKL